ncbi:LysR family transcriptional regulator [Rhizobiaceae bacterium n13]|uniref:LysR family transcriptional regulator n=1 Tax=Ferirhizobium litorale TaxID=2927786 RepID=A0AAE3Q7N8_9HYPH|nr:LysR family transcriptional regulator [Fererhizobium litorale]MDI7860552.1 LysR family transcriptional regulator [Fererhizobium litorale]MDI7920687.1 LysR family transcriptional regulator [Fererhizobium litorale]
MIKLDGIGSFVAVAESGSISGAARRLRLSKSVVSERLADLEATLGTTLMHRTTRKLTLTEDGIAFLERAVRINDDVAAAVSDISERRGRLVGPIRISAPVTFGRLHLGPALYPFLAEHPEIEMTLDLDDRRVDVSSGGYDAVVRHGPILDSRLMAWRLAPSRRVLVASRDYLEKFGVPASVGELGEHKGIFYTNRGVADWRFPDPAGTGDAVVVRGRLGLGLNNGDMIRDAAIAGLGIALLPMFIAGPGLRSGELLEVDIGLRPETEFIYIAHADGRQASAKLRALADHLRAIFGSPPYWEN